MATLDRFEITGYVRTSEDSFVVDGKVYGREVSVHVHTHKLYDTYPEFFIVAAAQGFVADREIHDTTVSQAVSGVHKPEDAFAKLHAVVAELAANVALMNIAFATLRAASQVAQAREAA